MRLLPSLLSFASFVSLTSLTAGCGQVVSDATSATDAGASSANAEAGVCCPRDTTMSGCMHLGGAAKNRGCGESCDFWCSTNWRVEKDESGCELWRYDMRQPRPDEDSTCLPKKPPPPTTTPDKACSTDLDCNGDPSVSAQWGKCFYGVCMCMQGLTVQANGKCNTTPAPDCPTQGGTCRQQPASCNSDELVVGTPPGDMSCGDVVEAVCCEKSASCKGPHDGSSGGNGGAVDFACCGPTDQVMQPQCVNGWQTCPAGWAPVVDGNKRCGG